MGFPVVANKITKLTYSRPTALLTFAGPATEATDAWWRPRANDAGVNASALHANDDLAYTRSKDFDFYWSKQTLACSVNSSHLHRQLHHQVMILLSALSLKRV